MDQPAFAEIDVETLARMRRDGEPLLIVVVCHHGIRSAQVAAWMRQNGLENAVKLAGGIDAWARRVDTTMKTY